MKTIADLAERASAELGELETRMRAAIENQNISDVLASARKKLDQVAQHPDAATELAALEPKDPGAPKFPFGDDKGDGA